MVKPPSLPFMKPDDRNNAFIDPSGIYRYDLRRQWGFDEVRIVNFIMLNPSKADAFLGDPTLTRCIDYAVTWGFDGLVITNLFAFRSTDPDQLRAVADPVGPWNDEFIARWATSSDLVVAAWGAKGRLGDRDRIVMAKLNQWGIEPHALKLTAGDYPCHPLRLPKRLNPFPMPPTSSATTRPRNPAEECRGHERGGTGECCDRAGEYNGFASGPTSFTCPSGCSCHH